ncbi:MAG: hypothetical protein L0154_17820 [Chloroflexi bacterium]|nr:hypothetical protein [Chloroflexota bacterium]
MISVFRKTFLIGAFLLIGLTTGLMALRSDIVSEYWITFVSTRTGLDQVYVMRGDGAKVKQLTNLGGPSGDYRWFYYPEWNELDKCIESGLGGIEEFCVSLTGEYTPIQRNNTLSQNILNKFGVAWSQYVRRDDGDWHIVSAQNQGLYRMRADGTELVKLSSREASGRISYFRQADLVSFLDPKQGWFLVSFDGTGETYIDTLYVK